MTAPDDNVVQMPTQLDRLVNMLKSDLVKMQTGVSKTEEGRKQWNEGAFDFCINLLEARRQRPAHIEFGGWCEDNGITVNHQTRAAAIAMAEEPEALRDCLAATKRYSIERIHREEFGRFTRARKTPKPPRKPRQAKAEPKTPGQPPAEPDPIEPRELGPIGEALRKAVREEVVQKGRVNRQEMAKEYGVSETTIESVEHRELGRLELKLEIERGETTVIPFIQPLIPDEMNPSMRKRYDLTVRNAIKQAREEIRAEIYEIYTGYIKSFNEKIERAERILDGHRGYISKEQYNTIRNGLHPDHNTFSQAGEAFNMFRNLQDILVKPEVKMSGPPLPKTAAEMMARRKTKW